MKQLCISLFMISISFLAFGQQSKIDSLQIELKNAITLNDSAKILVRLIAYNKKYKRKEDYKYNAIILASLLNRIDNEVIKAKSHYFNSLYLWEDRKFRRAYQEAVAATKLFRTLKDSTYVGRAVYFARLSALEFKGTQEAIDIFEVNKSYIDIKERYRHYYEMSKYFLEKKEDTETSLDYLNTALEIADSMGDPHNLGRVYYRIGAVYEYLRNFEEAEKSVLSAIENLNKERNKLLYGASFRTLAYIYLNQEKFELARSQLDSAYYYYSQGNYPNVLASILSDRSHLELLLENFNEAEENIRKAIGIRKSIDTDTIEEIMIGDFSRLGNAIYHVDKNKIDSAIYYMKQSLKLATKNELVSKQEAANYNLGNLYSDKGKYDLAFKHLKDSYKLKDSIYREDINNQLSTIKTKYQTEKKEKQILAQELDLEKKDNELSKTYNALYLSSSVILLFISIAVFTYKNRQKKKIALAKRELEIDNQELRINNDKAVLEKKRLLIGNKTLELKHIEGQLKKKGNDIENEKVILKKESLKLELQKLEKEVLDTEIEKDLHEKLIDEFNLVLERSVPRTRLLDFWLLYKEGWSHKEIATKFHIAIATSKFYRTKLVEKISDNESQEFTYEVARRIYLECYQKFKKEYLEGKAVY